MVEYHFNTTGWKNRLEQEFKDSYGGRYKIKNFDKIILPGKSNKKVEKLFPLIRYEEGITKSKIIFNSELGNSSEKLVSLNNSSLNFEIYIVDQAIKGMQPTFRKFCTLSKNDTKKAKYLYLKEFGFCYSINFYLRVLVKYQVIYLNL
ncbi:hypothetical protein ACQKCU_21915 [Heyndrickxia sporothermodurans]